MIQFRSKIQFLFFEALRRNHVPVEMHIYPVGGHGLSLANEETSHEDGRLYTAGMSVVDGTCMYMAEE